MRNGFIILLSTIVDCYEQGNKSSVSVEGAIYVECLSNDCHVT